MGWSADSSIESLVKSLVIRISSCVGNLAVIWCVLNGLVEIIQLTFLNAEVKNTWNLSSSRPHLINIAWCF